jgi:hypothetical protein
MSFFDIDQYNQTFKQKEEKWTSRPIKEGFLEWHEDEIDIWCGSYSGNTIRACLFDSSKKTLKTKEEIIKYVDYYVDHSKFDFPFKLTKELDELDLIKNKAERKSELSEDELEFLISCMTGVEKSLYEERCQERKVWMTKEYLSQPHQENPFQIYLAGTDDISYTAVFSTKEEMMNAFDNIVKYPNQATLVKFNFVFTN